MLQFILTIYSEINIGKYIIPHYGIITQDSCETLISNEKWLFYEY